MIERVRRHNNFICSRDLNNRVVEEKERDQRPIVRSSVIEYLDFKTIDIQVRPFESCDASPSNSFVFPLSQWPGIWRQFKWSNDISISGVEKVTLTKHVHSRVKIFIMFNLNEEIMWLYLICLCIKVYFIAFMHHKKKHLHKYFWGEIHPLSAKRIIQLLLLALAL